MLTIENMRDGYKQIVDDVLDRGKTVYPRGLQTREVLGGQFKLLDPTDALPTGTNRGLSLPFAAAEAAQLIGGVSSPQLLLRVNPTMDRFLQWEQLENDYEFIFQHGAYGPRINHSLKLAVKRLKADTDTRQAVVTIFDPERDYDDTPDVPCTLSLQFMIRDGKLVLHTTMRSNDLWWGTAYDVFQFTQLQLTVARILGIEPGPYFHHANSLHLYARDFEAATKLTYSSGFRIDDYPMGFSGKTVAEVQDRTRDLVSAVLSETSPREITYYSPSDHWYLRQLAYVSSRATESSLVTFRQKAV